MGQRTPMHRAMTALLVIGLGAVACGGGDATITEDSIGHAAELETTATSEADPTPSATPDPEPSPVPTAAPAPAPDPTATPEAGASWAADLAVGDCFDNAAAGDDDGLVAGPATDCEREHAYELFLLAQVDEPAGAPYPDTAAFTERLFTEFCDPATIEFAGAPWDRLPFGISVWLPPEQDWVGGDRTVGCAAEAGLRDENIYKVGTAAGATLTSDEGIVARSTVAGQRDYYFSFQASTLYPLTNGGFDLPNNSPHTLGVGFLFASSEQGGDESVAGAYSYDYATGEVTRLSTGLDGYELASPLFLADEPAFLVAGRETAEDDWDLYVARTPDDVVAITDDEADDRWPTLTPDGSRIVYHSGGDIWIMNTDGTDKQQLTTDPGGDFESAVSPDGTMIVFSSNRSGNDDVWAMDIDGSDQRNLTEHPANEAWPFFSADGSIIYFQTDRLGVSSNLMMMDTEGDNASYFSFEFMTNAALLPDEITERYKRELPTIVEALETRRETIAGLVPGAAGERAEVSHSSGRLVAALPGGWEYEEVETDDVASLLAAVSIHDFRSSWASDGALATLIEADPDGFGARIDGAAAANDRTCTLAGDSVEVDGSRTTTRRRYRCGSSSTAIVVAVYEADARLGLLFEGQWDGSPDPQTDQDLITAIGRALRWG